MESARMARACDNCGCTTNSRLRLQGGKFLGVDHCRCARAARARQSVNNPFGDLTLEHVKEEFGNPVHVSSIRQLEQAERRLNFSSVILAQDERNIDAPPIQRTITVDSLYRRKFASRG